MSDNVNYQTINTKAAPQFSSQALYNFIHLYTSSLTTTKTFNNKT